MGIRVRYLHSDVDTLDRIQIIRDLRAGVFDTLVGINLLREGLDLPEVSLVAILDADKEGFLRSERALIQTFGRAARNVNGAVILYADRMTDSMRRAIDETRRRRVMQQEFNEKNGIVPKTVEHRIFWVDQAEEAVSEFGLKGAEDLHKLVDDPKKTAKLIERLRKQMAQAAIRLEFEQAAELRDRIRALQAVMGTA